MSPSTGPRELESVFDWLGTAAARAVPASWVPGATTVERRSLGALGGLVRDLLEGPTEALPGEVRTWLARGPAVPDQVRRAARTALHTDPDAVLSGFYAGVVVAPHRRALGTFFTPPSEASLMLDLWQQSQPPPATVVDIGAGVGVFTAGAAIRWPSATIHAVDINPVTLGLLALRVAMEGSTSGVRLVCGDFISWLARSWPDTDAPGLITGNPPFTRLQLLPAAERGRLLEAAGGLCGSRASLSSLMTAASLRALRPADGLSLILPTQWLESQYAAGLRQELWRRTERPVELRLVDAAMFDDARVDSVILTVAPESEPGQPLVTSVWKGGDPLLTARIGDAPPSWRSLFAPTGPRSHTGHTGPPASPAPPAPPAPPAAVLADLVCLRRGTATGANHFFVLSEAERVAAQLPVSAVRPLIRRLQLLPTDVTPEVLNALDDETPRWLLVVTAADRRQVPEVDAYLRAGEQQQLNERELCRRRADWFDLRHDLAAPDVVVGAMSRGEFRLVRNAAGAIITNNLYGWRWHPEVAGAVRTRVWDWLVGAEGQQQLQRTAGRQADGLLKLEPGALKRLAIPAAVVHVDGGDPTARARRTCGVG